MNMKVAENWEDRDSLVAFLAKNLNTSRICLVLGAGISDNLGLPTWSKLLEALLGKTEAPPDYETDLSAIEKATWIRSNVYNNNAAAFHNDARKHLYSNFDRTFERLVTNPTLVAIGALVMASSRGSVSNVITFNFDDLLEIYLRH